MTPVWIEKNVRQEPSGLGDFFVTNDRVQRELWRRNKDNFIRLT